MKIISLDSIVEEPNRHNPIIKKKPILKNGDLPHGAILSQVNFPPGQIVEVHSHENICEVFFIRSGTGIIHIDGKTYQLEADTCIVVEPNEAHEVVNLGLDIMKLLVFQIPKVQK